MDLERLHEELVKLNAQVATIAEKAVQAERRIGNVESRLVTLLIAVCGALLAKLFL